MKGSKGYKRRLAAEVIHKAHNLYRLELTKLEADLDALTSEDIINEIDPPDTAELFELQSDFASLSQPPKCIALDLLSPPLFRYVQAMRGAFYVDAQYYFQRRFSASDVTELINSTEVDFAFYALKRGACDCAACLENIAAMAIMMRIRAEITSTTN